MQQLLLELVSRVDSPLPIWPLAFKPSLQDLRQGRGQGGTLRASDLFLSAWGTASFAIPGTQISLLECKASICRIEGTFANQKEYNDTEYNDTMFGILGSGAPDRIRHGGSMAPSVEMLEDGKIRATVYIAREGMPFIGSESSTP